MPSTDIEIAQQAQLRPITDVAAELGLGPDDLDTYGKYKAKLPLELAQRPPRGRLVLVTAVSPTPAGEGKTTVSVGLAQALRAGGTNAVLCIREPSLGPVFGVKGGAAGGGHAQVLPMEDINLHFTGDFHAIASAHGLLSAMLDNALHQGTAHGLDPRRVTWPRTVDMNDRALRHAVIGLGGATSGVVREERWVIVPASEVMAILALARDHADLEHRLGEIIVGATAGKERPPRARPRPRRARARWPSCSRTRSAPTSCRRSRAAGARPLRAVRQHRPRLQLARRHAPALALGDVVVTEAGFGSDLGAEKFSTSSARPAGCGPRRRCSWPRCARSRCRAACPRPTSRARTSPRSSAGCRTSCTTCATSSSSGSRGRRRQPPHGRHRGRAGDGRAARAVARRAGGAHRGVGARRRGRAGARPASSWRRSTAGVELPPALRSGAALHPREDRHDRRRVYGGAGADYAPPAAKAVDYLEQIGLDHVPVCMAKTPYSLSDDPAVLGRPTGFRVTIADVTPSAGAGFVVARCGEVMTMPGLPPAPAATRMARRPDGTIVGLF
jgi:formate--tetrahydrofolate ligase